jgi:hypothetical protein
MKLPHRPHTSSARIRQRFNVAARITSTTNHAITSLNTLSQSFFNHPKNQLQSRTSLPSSPPSQSQSRAVGHIYRCSARYVHACRQSGDVEFDQLSSDHSVIDSMSDGVFDSTFSRYITNDGFTYSSSQFPEIVPLQADRVSLPSSVGSVELSTILPPALRVTYSSPNDLIQSDVPSPFKRSGMVAGSHTEYVLLIKRMLSLGMVILTRKPKVVNGVFCVRKDGDQLRLIIDARSANSLFVEPPPVKLPTPDLLSRLVSDPSRPLFVAKVDLDNFYHRLRLPVWMRPYFALPPVTADELGLTGTSIIDGCQCTMSACDEVYPMCVTLPMGWSHSVYVAQLAHEHIVNTMTPLKAFDRITHENDFALDRTRHQIYIDDVNLFGYDQSEVNRLQTAYANAVESVGLRVKWSKYVPASADGVECIGMEVDGHHHSIGVRPIKLLRLQRETAAFVRDGLEFGASGIELSALIGRWTWACMAARPALAVFSAVYRFIECSKRRVFNLWPSVIRELNAISGLAPLLSTDMAAPAFDRVIATDASEYGEGVVSRRFHESDKAVATAPVQADCRDASPSAAADSGRWSTIVSSEWNRKEHINVLETRALITALSWVWSYPRSIGCRLFVWSDSKVLIGAVNKGRSSSPQLLRRLRSVSALCLATGMRLVLRWIPSELNPADGPSRILS